MSIRFFFVGILLALSGVFASQAASAQGHPYCLRALTDLQEARGVLQQDIDGTALTHNKKEALRQINEVIREMSEAAINDSKALDGHPKAGIDAATQCIDLLKKAKDNLSHEEDSHFANGLRDRSIKNCNAAIRFVEQDRHGVTRTTSTVPLKIIAP